MCWDPNLGGPAPNHFPVDFRYHPQRNKSLLPSWKAPSYSKPHPHRWKNHLRIQVSLLSRPTRCRSSRCTTAACGVDVLPAGWTRIKPTTWWPRCCNTPRRLKLTFFFVYIIKEWPQLCLGLNKSPIPQGWTKLLLTRATNKQIQTNAPGKKGTVCFVQKPWVKRKLTLQNRPFLFKCSKTLGPLSQRKRAASALPWRSWASKRKHRRGWFPSEISPFFRLMNHSPQKLEK